ncbi:hypothetical protein OF83DRAFT_1092474 [Amylostereum chailletii]|nr:hypothetical protein OF83DRAFT_1092474 [Amylostereum chailletii]
MSTASPGLLIDRAIGESHRNASSTSSLTPIPSAASPNPTSPSSYYIELPTLTAGQRERYVSILDRVCSHTSDEDEDRTPSSVTGEYLDGKVLWYYMKDGEGIAHKYEASLVERKYPDLLWDYKSKKKQGLLLPFDPSAAYVHPDSRVKMTINMKHLGQKSRRQTESSRRGSSKGDAIVLDSDEGEEWDHDHPEDESADEDDDEDATPPPSSRLTRGAAKRKLPFSPRKTRSRKQVSESDREDSATTRASSTRKSTRTRRSVRDNLADQDYAENTSDDEDEYISRPRRGKASSSKRPLRGAASRPAYGHFRPIQDLDWDPCDDEKTAALRAHRDTCEKCQRRPTHILLEEEKKRGNRKKKRRDDSDEDDPIEGSEQIEKLGGWVRCLKCPLSAHWRCLAQSQRDEILKAARARDRREREAKDGAEGEIGQSGNDHSRRTDLDMGSTTEFICTMCMKGGVCMGCMEVVLKPDSHHRPEASSAEIMDAGKPPPDHMADPSITPLQDSEDLLVDTPAEELLFRCQTCRRLAHYSHLPIPDFDFDVDPEDPSDRAILAKYYQRNTQWACGDCSSYVFKAEKIVAWRAYPPNAQQPSYPGGVPPPKVMLPREYLVKWQDRSWRRTEWVPHGWLAAVQPGLLRNFLTSGSKIELLKEAVSEDRVANDVAEGGVGEGHDESRDSSTKPEPVAALLDACPDAERRIPPAWKTVDRVLDVLMWHSHKATKQPINKGKLSRRRIVDDDDPDFNKEWDAAFKFGKQPSDDFTESLDDFVRRKEDDLEEDDVDQVVWAFIKWDDLGYDEASWDSPPREGEPGYAAFKAAFRRLVDSRKVEVQALSRSDAQAFDNRKKGEYRKKYALKDETQPALGQAETLKLMPFQIDGFNWLCDNWWSHQPCILADEMGLGKTVQICTFIGHISEIRKARPFLVVVPNSTITNWVREFTRWAPKLRVVPFYGEAKAREVIKRYELTHSSPAKGTTGAKFHVLVTTYNTITNAKEFGSVFKSQPRWEGLIIDEGQRLNNDNSIIFKKLRELKTMHRIIMTGTPLNNNIRELFNLMNFLDPENWHDLAKLEKEFEVLTEELVKDLHQRLKPYFLRRIKAQVLKLPPKNEVIVPVSLAPLQKEMYKSILSKNVHILQSLSQSGVDPKTRSNATGSKTNMNNMLMQLRKCVQHPYLLSTDIEPKGLAQQEAHDRLVGASSKLRLLHGLLPKLKSRGHRVLLFSQFVIVLDIIEDFLVGEGIKYLRLDGNTPQADRQRGMDEFNRPDSDVFIYILTTRAGGVGINLWSADTVVIFDPDFNPHQDLQAIARAHRFGQTKPCLVFKLMAKDTAEERIIQTGKKKLVLDHLIVQKMDDDDGAADVQSILTYGAKTLFDEENQAMREIVYTDHDLDNLIEKTETEVTPEEPGEAAQSFSFAKIWTADKDAFEDIPDEGVDGHDEPDSWAATLQRIAEERDKHKEAEATGRGVRRKAAMPVKPQQSFNFDDTPVKKDTKGKRKRRDSTASRESAGWTGSGLGSDREGSDISMDSPDEFIMELNKRARQKPARPTTPDDEACGICRNSHPGPCTMTDSSPNLAEYRRLLIFETTDEPFETRRRAIEVIDETLFGRGHLHLIHGQPLRLLEMGTHLPPAPPRPAIASTVTSLTPRAQPTPSLSNNRSKPVVSPRLHAPNTSARTPSVAQSSVAGPSRVVSSPMKRVTHPTSPEHGVVRKRAKNDGTVCVVCGRSPHHLIKDCPTVAEGPPGVKSAIDRLAPLPEHSNTVKILRRTLEKQKMLS